MLDSHVHLSEGIGVFVLNVFFGDVPNHRRDEFDFFVRSHDLRFHLFVQLAPLASHPKVVGAGNPTPASTDHWVLWSGSETEWKQLGAAGCIAIHQGAKPNLMDDSLPSEGFCEDADHEAEHGSAAVEALSPGELFLMNRASSLSWNHLSLACGLAMVAPLLFRIVTVLEGLWLLLGLPVDDRFSPLRVELPAEWADGAVAAPGCAVLASVKDDLQVKPVPALFGEQ